MVEGLLLAKDDPLSCLYLIFRIFAIPISKEDHLGWKLYTFVIFLCLLISLFGIIISAINKLNEDIFNSISAILFCVNGFFSYSCLIFTIYFYPQCNFIQIIKDITKIDNLGTISTTATVLESPIREEYNSRRLSNVENPLLHESNQYHPSLKYYCYKWLSIAACIGFLSYSLLFVAYGSQADSHFFDVGDNPGWHAGNLIYFHVNAGWLLPMVIVRVGCHFLEEKIFDFIEYLEQPESRTITTYRSQSTYHPSTESKDSHKSCIVSRRLLAEIRLHTSSDAILSSPQLSSSRLDRINSFSQLSIQQVMSWYDELYLLNQTLSDAFSLIIFQSILGLFPIVVFMLQGFIVQDLSVRTTVALFYWVFFNSLILFVITASAARIDSLNIRIETALATMPSSIMFSSDDSISSYRLALSKIRSIPFGINFYGLRKRITFQAMWTISSVVLSIFLLMFGYSL